MLAGTAIAQPLLSNHYNMPQTGSIPTVLSVGIKTDGTTWTNGTSIAWGTLNQSSTPTKSVEFANTGTIPISSIAFVSIGLPSGWSLTMPSLTTVLNPKQSATGTLTLTVPSNATAGDYSWNSIITVNQ